uniref:exodeoxyribonuclease III n=1 Tax=Electrophorus electricus TaxID=8005 RepID=A0A4W4E9Z8_ELEEL
MNSNNKKQSLTILSWNVNGFILKKSNILNYLKLLRADVVFLQETHVGPSANCPAGSIQIQGLYPDYDWAVFTTFKNTCRGVAVLFREGLGCEGLRVVGDDKGRYLIISCKIQEKEFEFVNVYNPTDELIDFNQFRDDLLSPSEATYFVIGGDFNTVMDAEFDRTSNIRNRGHRVRFTGLMSFLETFNLVDIWRWLYPEEKSFTYFDVKGKSRLDYFFLRCKNLTSLQLHRGILTIPITPTVFTIAVPSPYLI